MNRYEYAVSIHGIAGKVVSGHCGPVLHGRWASHTGYRSLASGRDRIMTELEAVELARAAYNEHATYPFVVGEEHKQHGWKSIRINYDGRVEIRLPDWHEGVVAKAIGEMGMAYTDELNNYYSFPETVPLAVAKRALAPILERGTRFTCETLLARALSASGGAAELLCRQEQMSFNF